MRCVPLLFLVACGSGSDTDTIGHIVLVEGDALNHLGRSNTSTFWETTDVDARDDAVYTCTGVQSLVVHDASEPSGMGIAKTITFPDSDVFFPRCTHIDIDGARMVVSSHADEIQTGPFISLLDISEPLSPTKIVSKGFENTLIEEVVVVGERVYVAATTDGLLAYDVGANKFETAGSREGLGTVTRVESVGERVVAGTTGGQVHVLDAGLDLEVTINLGGAVQAMLDLGGGRMAVALGGQGLAIVDVDSGVVLGQTDTRGQALRLARMPSGRVLLANWTDMRVYDVNGDVPELLAVDAVFQSEDKPRTFGVAFSGENAYAGTWTGLHALRWTDGETSPEMTPSTLEVGVAADGLPADVPFRIDNEGPLDLVVSKVKMPEGWSAEPDAFTVPPGKAQQMVLHHGGSESVRLQEMTIQSDDVDEPRADIALRVGSDSVFIGDEAIDFTYDSLNMPGTWTLSDYRGQVVLLSYFATF